MENSNVDLEVIVKNLESMVNQVLEDKDNVSVLSEENEINKSMSSKSRMEKMDGRLDTMDGRLDIIDNNLHDIRKMLEYIMANKESSHEEKKELDDPKTAEELKKYNGVMWSNFEQIRGKVKHIEDGLAHNYGEMNKMSVNVKEGFENLNQIMERVSSAVVDNKSEMDSSLVRDNNNNFIQDGNLILANMVISEDYTYKEEVLDDKVIKIYYYDKDMDITDNSYDGLDDMDTLDDRCITTEHTYMRSNYNRFYMDGLKNKSIIDDYAYKDIRRLDSIDYNEIEVVSTDSYINSYMVNNFLIMDSNSGVTNDINHIQDNIHVGENFDVMFFNNSMSITNHGVEEDLLYSDDNSNINKNNYTHITDCTYTWKSLGSNKTSRYTMGRHGFEDILMDTHIYF